MIVYNISIKVSPPIEKEWVQWQLEEHIPDIMSSGKFSSYRFYRLLEQDDAEGVTYVVQYFAASLEDYHHYIRHTAPLLRQKALDKWGDQFIAFRSLMEVVD